MVIFMMGLSILAAIFMSIIITLKLIIFAASLNSFIDIAAFYFELYNFFEILLTLSSVLLLRRLVSL